MPKKSPAKKTKKASPSKKGSPKKAAAGTTKRKVKKAKDPNAPKKAGTAYMIWLNKTRSTIAKPGMSVTDVAKKGGELWRKMTENDKKPFEKEAAKDKERYQREMSKYKGSS